ncbi:MAG: type 2 isopentenyl-diphosphate Delta-isomerase [Bacillota bacterium]
MRNNNSEQRLARKLDHLKFAQGLYADPIKTGFNDVFLIHNAASSLALDEVDISCFFLQKKLAAPFMINAISGGPPLAGEINRSLARTARRFNIAMAVGSQKIAIDDRRYRDSFSLVRKENPTGVILANLSALSPVEDVLTAIEMMEANGIQLHLNLPQELAMKEGDRNFKGMLENIARIVESTSVPVIVKEVGFGISGNTAQALWERGVAYLDVGGYGGTNFATIERQRQNELSPTVFEEWGIPTAISLAEITSLSAPIKLIASGGIRNALDALKAMALGAELVAFAGSCLRALSQEKEDSLSVFFNDLIYQFRALSLLVGSGSISEISNIPIIITGKTRQWLEQRNAIQHYFKRTYMNF